jgi:hypothetical protein
MTGKAASRSDHSVARAACVACTARVTVATRALMMHHTRGLDLFTEPVGRQPGVMSSAAAVGGPTVLPARRAHPTDERTCHGHDKDIAEAFSGHRFAEAVVHPAADARWVLVGQTTIEGRDAIVAACENTPANWLRARRIPPVVTA